MQHTASKTRAHKVRKMRGWTQDRTRTPEAKKRSMDRRRARRDNREF